MNKACCNNYSPARNQITIDPNPRVQAVAVAVWEHLQRRGCALPGFLPGVKTLAFLAVCAEDERATIERIKAGPANRANRNRLSMLSTEHRRSLALLRKYRRQFLDPPIPTIEPAEGASFCNV